MDNPEKLATLGTQDTGRRQTKQKTNPYTQGFKNVIILAEYAVEIIEISYFN
jgi:hypothetical protein